MYFDQSVILLVSARNQPQLNNNKDAHYQMSGSVSLITFHTKGSRCNYDSLTADHNGFRRPSNSNSKVLPMLRFVDP